MRKKYIWLPGAILIYSVIMGWYGWTHNGGPTEGFWTVAIIELIVVVALFFLLRAQERRK